MSYLLRLPLLLQLQCLLVLLAIAIAVLRPEAGSEWFASAEKLFGRFAQHRLAAAFSLVVLVMAGRLALLPLLPVPEPAVHDEFSYLLAADTFASGRLTNTPHRYWQFFESMHILQQPTYMSMYAPAQGLLLSVGQKLTGIPWTGVWAGMGILTAAVCWMLHGWVSSGWALLGGFVFALRSGFFNYWMNSYYGGIHAALGGVLVLGALPRLLRRPRWSAATVLGVGCAILLNSRPFEGLMFLLGLVVCGMWIAVSRGFSRLPAAAVWRIAVPLVAVLALTAAAMAHYNWRVTGNPVKMPYSLNRETYAMAKHFIWQTPRPEPVYRDETIREFYTQELALHEGLQHFPNLWKMEVIRATAFGNFFLGPVLILPFFFVLRRVREPHVALLLAATGATVIGLAGEVWFFPHYASPVTGAMLLLVVSGLRTLREWRWRGQQSGLFLVRSAPVLLLLIFLADTAGAALGLPQPGTWPMDWRGVPLHREQIAASLKVNPAPDLVFVRYHSGHDPGQEWVYNAADIDKAHVVWARDKGLRENDALIRYFHGRQVWLLEPDCSPHRLTPYPILPLGKISADDSPVR